MEKWPYQLIYCSMDDIQKFCVYDKQWQQFRKSLRGLPTTEKLDQLAIYWRESFSERTEVQVTNYINALKRGGFLDKECQVVR